MRMSYSQKLYLCVVPTLIASIILNFWTSELIQRYFPERPSVDDLLFRLTPYVGWTQHVTDLANVFSVGLMAFHIIWHHQQRVPYVMATFALMETIRGIAIILTPLGGYFGNWMHYGLTGIHQHGEFPSGHTAVVVLCYYLVKRKDAPWVKRVLLASVFAEVVCLILSRGHYSIDILGGFGIAYFANNEMSRFEAALTARATSPEPAQP